MGPAPAAGTPRDRGLGGGCGLLLALIALGLVGSFLILDRGVDWLVDRARTRIVDSLPAELGAARRAAIEARLARFVDGLPRAAERERLTGEFLGQVGRVLDDRRLSVAEAEQLDLWIARALHEAAVDPPPGSGP